MKSQRSDPQSAIARLPDLAAFAVIVAFVYLLSGRDLGVGGLDWSDAPLHTFDGIFILDFVRHASTAHAMDWAQQFYLHYPCLGIIVYYPPGFALVEAVMFALCGVGVATARATVLLFAIGAGWLVYALGKRWFDRPSGLFAAFLLLTCPHGVRWLRDVMLEWPALFWMLLALYAYQRDRDRLGVPATASRFWPIATAIAVLAAFLTKQPAAFIGPVILLHAVIARDRQRYFARLALIASWLFVAGAVIAYQAAVAPFAVLLDRLVALAPDFLFYPRHLPEILGWPLLPVAALGIISMIRRVDRAVSALLLLLFFSWLIFSSLIVAKEPRYFFFAVPMLTFAATRVWLRDGGKPRGRDRARIAILALLIATQTILAVRTLPPRLLNYAAAVNELAARPDADLVLIDAVRDGQFVFDLYQNSIARRRIIPLRASKLLYARAARERFVYEQFVSSQQEILALLDRYGIRYIVIESALPRTPYVEADPPPRRMLRELLTTDPRFQLVASWPLRCADPIWDKVELRVYAYPTCPPRTTDRIDVSFPGMGRRATLRIPAL